MLLAQQLSCIRGERLLFKDVSLAIEPGSLQYILGENGAGKSSLLRILAGLLTPETGRVSWQGYDIRKNADAYYTRLRFVGHLNAVKLDLSARENLTLSLNTVISNDHQQRIDAALQTVKLHLQSDVIVRNLSQGQQRRVALARLWLDADESSSGGALWILDEPFASLDAAMTAELTARIEQFLAQGGMVVLTTHQEVAIHAAHIQSYRLTQ